MLLSTQLWLWLNPLHLLLLLVILMLIWPQKIGRFLAAALLILAFILPMGPWALRSLEKTYPPIAIQDLAPIDGILVLGGGMNLNVADETGQLALTDATERLVYAGILAQHFPKARLVFAGGRQDPRAQTTEADLAKAYFQTLSLANPQQFENLSRNTMENFVLGKSLAAPQSGETWLLVTSAFHMKRAMIIAQSVDWPMIPFPVDYRVSQGGASYWLENAELLRKAFKEYLALFHFKFLRFV